MVTPSMQGYPTGTSDPAAGMNVLHICSDYCRQRLYSELCRSMSRLGFVQVMYCATRNESEAAVALSNHDEDYEVVVRPILRPRHRLLFRTRIAKVAHDVERHVQLQKIDLVHAHFLFSDGAVALRLKRDFGIPFVTAVRNTDLNVFMKYRPDLRGIMQDVIMESSKVVCLTPAYGKRLAASVDGRTRSELEQKIEIIPNGIRPDWFSTELAECPGSESLKIICVQDGSRNKNVRGLVAAASILARSQQVHLTIVGASPRASELTHDEPRLHIELQGRVDCWQRLAELYRGHHVFAMPSFHESFGLVYIEAMSQGVPIVHARGEGPSGLFESSILVAEVDPKSPTAIATGVLRVLDYSPLARQMCRMSVLGFSLSEVSKKYASLYIGR
jgi:glycosyltransferase involved in cell wall biosynthesis